MKSVVNRYINVRHRRTVVGQRLSLNALKQNYIYLQLISVDKFIHTLTNTL